MPSPLAHSAMGYVIYRISRQHKSPQDLQYFGPIPRLLLATAGLSILPDADAIPGLLMNNVGQFHNNVMSSLTFGVITAVGIGSMVWLRQRSGFKLWFGITLLCYWLHVLMDFFTIGRGVMLFWPFSLKRYVSPLKLFYGFHYSEGWFSLRHLWTLVTELGFAFIIIFAVHMLLKKKSFNAELADT
jgi:hypothetical protein